MAADKAHIVGVKKRIHLAATLYSLHVFSLQKGQWLNTSKIKNKPVAAAKKTNMYREKWMQFTIKLHKQFNPLACSYLPTMSRLLDTVGSAFKVCAPHVLHNTWHFNVTGGRAIKGASITRSLVGQTWPSNIDLLDAGSWWMPLHSLILVHILHWSIGINY